MARSRSGASASRSRSASPGRRCPFGPRRDGRARLRWAPVLARPGARCMRIADRRARRRAARGPRRRCAGPDPVGGQVAPPDLGRRVSVDHGGRIGGDRHRDAAQVSTALSATRSGFRRPARNSTSSTRCAGVRIRGVSTCATVWCPSGFNHRPPRSNGREKPDSKSRWSRLPNTPDQA